MSDRRSWLEEWCPRCSTAPGRCCRVDFGAKRRGPAPWLHIARGHRERRCPTCKAYPGEPCRTRSGREASGPHEARLRAGAGELVGRDQAWAQLERCCVQVAAVRFSGRSGRGDRVESTTLSLLVAARRVEKQLWDEDELACGLAAPAWDRYGAFAGHPAEELAWPGTSVAAVRAGMSASAFLEARDRLAGRGLVAMEEPGHGRGKASTLRLLFAQTGPWWEGDINVELLEAVLCRSRASGSARVLLAVLSALSDKDGVVEDRSTDELRRAAGMADSTYRRARTALLQAGDAAVNGDRGGRGVKSRWMIPHPRELGLAPARASTKRPEPPAARSLLAPVATAGESAAAAPVRTVSDRLDQSAKGPDLSGVSGAECPDPGGVSVRKGPDLSGVSPGKCPVSSGVSAPPVAKTPPKTPPPNARAGREPLNPRTLDPPSPPEGGSIPTSITIEQEYRTDRGRKRRRTVRIEVDAVLQALGPPPGPQDPASWLKTRQLLIEAVGESTFEIWLATIAVIGVDRAGALVLDVPSDVRGWVQARFGRILEACAAKANRTVRFATDVESAAVRAITAAGGRADKNVEGDRTDAGDGRFGAPPPDDWHADEWAGATAWRSSPTGGHAASYPSLNHQERKVSR